MSKEAGKSNSFTEDLVTEVFDELSSSGFLEQLRLECVANVKTMSTYLQLKNRFVDLLNKKLSSADWKFEVAAPRLNILREQIVECSVLAVTIERVVDEVVSWKLREQIVPLIKEILCSVYDHKTVGKLKLSNLAKLGDGNPSFSQLKEVIKKICNHIHVDWKHVFKDETIGKSLASIDSHISDDGSSSEESDSDSDIEIISDDKLKQSEKNKRKIEIIVDEEETRSKRERKKNSKYFSDIYDTPEIKTEFISEKPSTPESTKSSPLNSSIYKNKDMNNFVTNGVRKSMRLDRNEKSSMKSPKERRTPEKKYPKITEIAIKSEPMVEKVPISELTNNKKGEELKNDVKNGFVRKSVRQHKPNSRLFWEPGDSPQKVRALMAEQEADQDLKQMELTIIQNELRHDITQAFIQPKSEFPPHRHNTSSKKSTASPKENQRESDSKKKSVSPESSSQKYSLAELYKHKPVTNGKRGRPRKDGINKISAYKN